MSSNLLPLLVIFAIDHTLWQFYVDFDVVHPCSKKNGQVVDKNGTVLKYYPEVPAVFEKLKSSNIQIAVYEYCQHINETIQLINMFGWDKYISVIELFNKENKDRDSLANIQKKSNISHDKMIFFNKYGDTDVVYREFGFFHAQISDDYGITVKRLDDALKEYELKQQENIKPSYI